MLERIADYIEDYFLTEPKRLIGLGRFLAYLGAWIILAGVMGHVATAATGAVASLGGHAAVQAKSLADIYPSWPTWWVPESIIGVVPALLLVGLGFWFNHMGRQLQHFLGY